MKISVDNVKVFIYPEAKQKIEYWVDKAPGEISGMGIVNKERDIFTVSEVFLVKQSNTSAETEMDDDAMSKLLLELTSKGLDAGALRFWWHSHGRMNVFWSGTDVSTQESFKPDTFFISSVFNKNRECLTKLNIIKPIKIEIDEIPILVKHPPVSEEIKSFCDKEYDDKISVNSPPNLEYAKRGDWGQFDFGDWVKRYREQPEDIRNTLPVGEPQNKTELDDVEKLLISRKKRIETILMKEKNK